MYMFGYYEGVWKKYAVFSGRARRAEYWYFTLVNVLITMAAAIVDSVIAQGMHVQKPEDFTFIGGLYGLAVLIPSIAVGVRRLHDSDKSGWWLLLPFYNLYLLIRKGTVGPNFYGPDPKAETIAMPVSVPSPDTPPGDE